MSDPPPPTRPRSPVGPSSFLRPRPPPPPPPPPPESLSPIDQDQQSGLRAIRAFLKLRTSYDVLPVSFRLIVLDTGLLVKRSLNILVQNGMMQRGGIVSAPLWNSSTSTFAGLLTSSDYINVIQYYRQNPNQLPEIDRFKLSSLREIEQAIGATPIETVSVHPMAPLYQACCQMLKSRARRIPLIDVDDETQQQMVVSVLTQFRILKFVAFNVGETTMLRKPLHQLNIITPLSKISSARMETPVTEVIELLVKNDISSVPIVDANGVLLNIYESVDILTLIKGGFYDDLSLSVGEALLKRPEDFPGVHTCSMNDSLDAIFHTIRKSRVHRLMIVDDEKRLEGILTLSDILQYILFRGEDGS